MEHLQLIGLALMILPFALLGIWYVCHIIAVRIEKYKLKREKENKKK